MQNGIRGSEQNDFLRCRLKWKWAWVDGYKPKQTAAALSFGILVHKWLEVFYNTGNCWDADEAMRDLYFNSPEIQQNDEIYTLADGVVFNYFKHYTDTFEVVATELTFMIPLDDEIAYTGTIDLVYKQNGKLYFMDHKTTTSIDKYTKNSDMDRQISRYWWALQQLAKGNGYVLEEWYEDIVERGDEVTGQELVKSWIPVERAVWLTEKLQEPAGFMYNIIKKDVPEPPKVLKSGKLSQDKAQHTTFDLYINALEKMGLYTSEGEDCYTWPEEYKEILLHLRDNPREYFKRVEVIRNQAEIDASIQEFFATAKDMSYVRNFGSETVSIYRNITQDCPHCPFYEPCKASLDGSDAEHLLTNLYTKETKNGHHGLCN